MHCTSLRTGRQPEDMRTECSGDLDVPSLAVFQPAFFVQGRAVFVDHVLRQHCFAVLSRGQAQALLVMARGVDASRIAASRDEGAAASTVRCGASRALLGRALVAQRAGAVRHWRAPVPVSAEAAPLRAVDFAAVVGAARAFARVAHVGIVRRACGHNCF